MARQDAVEGADGTGRQRLNRDASLKRDRIRTLANTGCHLSQYVLNAISAGIALRPMNTRQTGFGFISLLIQFMVSFFASYAISNTIVIVKQNTAISWTTYQADNLGQSQVPYARKLLKGVDSEAQYEIMDLTTGGYALVSNYTYYNKGQAIKRYSFQSQSGAPGPKNFGPCASVKYSRLVSPNTAPKYQYVSRFKRRDQFGGPGDTVSPSTYEYRLDGLFHVTIPVGLTVIIPGRSPVPPIQALVPISAVGTDDRYEFEQSYTTDDLDPQIILPDPVSKIVTLSLGKVTQTYDSVLTGRANALTVPAAGLIDYDGTTLSPNTLSYAIKLVRDALEALGYEFDGFDTN